MTTIERVLSVGAVLLFGGLLSRCGDSNSSNPIVDLGTPKSDLAHAAAPTLTMASPAMASNKGGAMLTLTGSGFVTGATVTIGGVAATMVTVVSSTQITCVVAAKAQTCGAAAIVVTNPDMQSASAPSLFSYLSGTFGYAAAQSTAANGVAGPAGLAAGDLSGDGKPDLIISNLGAAGTNSTVSLLLGQGGASFANPATSPVLIQPRGVAVADFDGNKLLDVAVVDSGSNLVSVLLGNGNGTLTSKSQTGGGVVPNSVVVGDFDGNGHLDLAVAATGTAKGGGTVTVLLGNGDGTFTVKGALNAGASTNSVAARDVNGDNHLDLIAGSSSGIDVFLGAGDGSFAAAVAFLSGTAVSAVGAADLDGTGNLDIYALNGNAISVLLNAGGTGAGLFGTPSLVATGGTGPMAALAYDLDGDGKTDLVTANATSNNVSVLLGKGGGSFPNAQTYPVAPSTTPSYLVAVDLNADGTPDLATANTGTANVSILLSQCM